LTFGVSLGDKDSSDYERFGENADNKILAEKLDESLDIIKGLWTGRPFGYRGKHYRMGKTMFVPAPLQKPRIPIWLGGFWPRKKPFRRVAKWDRTIPGKLCRPRASSDVIIFVREILTFSSCGPRDKQCLRKHD
jgi:hypothetical protein